MDKTPELGRQGKLPDRRRSQLEIMNAHREKELLNYYLQKLAETCIMKTNRSRKLTVWQAAREI